MPVSLYAAACGTENDLKDPGSSSKDYFLPSGETVAFKNLPEVVAANFQSGDKPGSSVFMSREILEGIVGKAAEAPVAEKVRFFVVEINEVDSRNVPSSG